MPAGCDFICKNKNCENFDKGFVIKDYWPMGAIELVVNSIAVKKNKDLREIIIKEKNENNAKLFAIQFPNEDLIPIKAYRVEFWSPEAKCIWKYEIPANEENEEVEGVKPNLDELKKKAIENGTIPTKCEKTGCDLRDFRDVVSLGIQCPSCKEKMLQNRWFSNDK